MDFLSFIKILKEYSPVGTLISGFLTFGLGVLAYHTLQARILG